MAAIGTTTIHATNESADADGFVTFDFAIPAWAQEGDIVDVTATGAIDETGAQGTAATTVDVTNGAPPDDPFDIPPSTDLYVIEAGRFNDLAITHLATWDNAGRWHLPGHWPGQRDQRVFVWRRPGDVPLAGNDFDEIVIVRPTPGGQLRWWATGLAGARPPDSWGKVGDVPLLFDFDRDGSDDIGVYRPSDGTWWVHGIGRIGTFGGVAGMLPVPGVYGSPAQITADLALYDPAVGTLHIAGQPSQPVFRDAMPTNLPAHLQP